MNKQQTKNDVPVVLQQTQLEFETLGHIKKALRGTIKADAREDLSRKLSSVRFVTSSLQRYVERQFALEEHDGYMTEVAATHPHLLHKINRLRTEHDTLRESLRQIVTRLDLLAPTDAPALEAIGKELLGLLVKLDQHTDAEMELLEVAYLQETGGEGGM